MAKIYKKLTTDFTVVSNEILKNKLSLKAIGLYLYIAQKPNEWEFSMVRIAEQISDGEMAVRSAVKELEEAGFLERKMKYSNNKIRGYDWYLYDKSILLKNQSVDFTPTANQSVENQSVENTPTIVSTNIVNTNKVNTNIILGNDKIIAENNKKFNALIDKFKNINPHYKKFFSNKTERAALQVMIDEYTHERMDNLLNQLPGLVTKPYAPRITSPTQLYKKMGELIIFMKQEQLKGGGTVDARHTS